ncbi:hypothetical protein HOLleu_37370 [Holothuria leucospilota]|uniref:Uncharacterized protein n=1 Tax=Holothuria leucospilota TaxID=206669 RepID=A0A9Q0YLS2_HOLLE|nr:hypothetical protein HOLleu_37370 [Holothuria leucospilota]
MRSFVFVLFVIISTLVAHVQGSYTCTNCNRKTGNELNLCVDRHCTCSDCSSLNGVKFLTCRDENSCPNARKRSWNQDKESLQQEKKYVSTMIEEVLSRLSE